MAKFPVTYRQFQAFVDSGEYAHERWWSGFPPKYRPQPIAEQSFRFDSHPRDNVSWYQAVAFTRWLTARLQRAGQLAEGLQIRLPTEEEWEYAARGTDERRYPYPGEFDSAKCNSRQTGIRQTSAVGLFPDGASPFGVLDMSGNVWEWCLNDYAKPQIVDGYGNGERKVLRGGSWYDPNADDFRCDYRFRYLPVVRLGNRGFRLALSS
jgi:formylglycine-generating enzyme required for sulfatase activity